jgi:predicted nucleotide-binding protein (sugar kinase/HSP70/actin superfamily)
MSRRRIEKEFQELSLVYANVTIDEYVITLDNKKFVFDKCYPFKSPMVYIGGDTYFAYLRAPPRIQSILQKNGLHCLCCNSILCDWTPMYRINTILDELHSFNKIKSDIKYHLIIEEIAKKNNVIQNVKSNIYPYLMNVCHFES